ncbi:MAG: hypothetical protein EOP11_10000, partial [Proteobacteria bacterium]
MLSLQLRSNCFPVFISLSSKFRYTFHGKKARISPLNAPEDKSAVSLPWLKGRAELRAFLTDAAWPAEAGPSVWSEEQRRAIQVCADAGIFDPMVKAEFSAGRRIERLEEELRR